MFLQDTGEEEEEESEEHERESGDEAMDRR